MTRRGHFDLSGISPDRVADWVDAYLRGSGGNVPFADGLKLAPRHWEGPNLVAVGDLQRCCGPEPEMEYVMPPTSWTDRVSRLVSHLQSGGLVPPLIVNRQEGVLSVRDGNHRLAALQGLGVAEVWVLEWGGTFRHGDTDWNRSQTPIDP